MLVQEDMSEVVALGSEMTNLKVGVRMAVSSTVSCGDCWFCKNALFAACYRTNPHAEMSAKTMGHSPADLFGFSAAMDRSLTIKLGQIRAQRYTKPLLEKVVAGEIDPSLEIAHPVSLEDAPKMHARFRGRTNGVIKVVVRPHG